MIEGKGRDVTFSQLLRDGSNGLVCTLFSDVLVCSITSYFYLQVVPEQLVKILRYTTHLKRLISYLLPNCLFYKFEGHKYRITYGFWETTRFLIVTIYESLDKRFSTRLVWDHSRFLVNQTKNSRSKTTTIPRFATLRHTRLDYTIEPRFFDRGSFLHPRLVFKKKRKKEKKGRKKERKEGRKKRRMEGRKKEREKEYCKLKN